MKIRLIFILLFFSSYAKSQITIDSISKFETVDYDKISLPIIKARSQNGDKLFLIDTGASFSIFDMSVYNGKSYYRYLSDNNSITLHSVNSSFKVSCYSVIVVINNVNYRFMYSSLAVLNDAFGKFEIVGILGNDWLKVNKATIDYKNRKLIINN